MLLTASFIKKKVARNYSKDKLNGSLFLKASISLTKNSTRFSPTPCATWRLATSKEPSFKKYQRFAIMTFLSRNKLVDGKPVAKQKLSLVITYATSLASFALMRLQPKIFDYAVRFAHHAQAKSLWKNLLTATLHERGKILHNSEWTTNAFNSYGQSLPKVTFKKRMLQNSPTLFFTPKLKKV